MTGGTSSSSSTFLRSLAMYFSRQGRGGPCRTLRICTRAPSSRSGSLLPSANGTQARTSTKPSVEIMRRPLVDEHFPQRWPVEHGPVAVVGRDDLTCAPCHTQRPAWNLQFHAVFLWLSVTSSALLLWSFGSVAGGLFVEIPAVVLSPDPPTDLG